MVGSSVALVAAGLALLFGVLHIINFAQGDFFMMGGYAVWFFLSVTHNYVLAMVLGTLLVAIGGGAPVSPNFPPVFHRSPVPPPLPPPRFAPPLRRPAPRLHWCA